VSGAGRAQSPVRWLVHVAPCSRQRPGQRRLGSSTTRPANRTKRPCPGCELPHECPRTRAIPGHRLICCSESILACFPAIFEYSLIDLAHYIASIIRTQHCRAAEQLVKIVQFLNKSLFFWNWVGEQPPAITARPPTAASSSALAPKVIAEGPNGLKVQAPAISAVLNQDPSVHARPPVSKRDRCTRPGAGGQNDSQRGLGPKNLLATETRSSLGAQYRDGVPRPGRRPGTRAKGAHFSQLTDKGRVNTV
jgi:hypothetical protein